MRNLFPYLLAATLRSADPTPAQKMVLEAPGSFGQPAAGIATGQLDLSRHHPRQRAQQLSHPSRHYRLQEKELFFYHNGSLSIGGSYRRSICVAEMHYNPDGTSQPLVQTAKTVAPAQQVWA